MDAPRPSLSPGLVILDTNIWVRASAFEPEEIDPFRSSPSQHDQDSYLGDNQITPSQCRYLISTLSRNPGSLFIPDAVVSETFTVMNRLERTGSVHGGNSYIMQNIRRFMRSASAPNGRVILGSELTEQHQVIGRALEIAHSTALGTNALDRKHALRFIEKNEKALAQTLPGPNLERLSKFQSPTIHQDWLLCRIARLEARNNCHLLSADRDIRFLGAAFKEITGHDVAKVIEYQPLGIGVDEFVTTLESPAASAAVYHGGGRRAQPPERPTPQQEVRKPGFEPRN